LQVNHRPGPGRVDIVADEPNLTPHAGLLVTGEIARRTGLVESLDAEIAAVRRAPAIKMRARGISPGALVASLAEAQLAGGTYFEHLRALRADLPGAPLRAVPETPAPQTALRLAGGFRTSHLRALERGLAAAGARLDSALGRPAGAPVTLDVDTLPVVVHGRQKQGAGWTREGRRAYQPLVVTWAQRGRPVAWELLSGSQIPRGRPATAILRRALALLPDGHGPVWVRMDSAFYALETLEELRRRRAVFSLSVPRFPVFWRALAAIPADAWEAAEGMEGAEVAETTYTPEEWSHGPLRLVVRRVRIACADISADARARRRRTIPKDQLALAAAGQLGFVYGYSFILTSAGPQHDAVEVERHHRMRAQIEERFKDAKLGMALSHLPSGKRAANLVWLAASLVALALAAMTCDLHPAARASDRTPPGVDPRDRRPLRRHGATLRRLLICVPARVARTARRLVLHLPAGFPGAAGFAAAYAGARALAVP
jgi:hypothetical protein